ncbi:MAG: FAD-binding oxidoreductase [Paenibacillaceae bacterium]|nr:FAD-binding oxidoreductase [Paenibacillaceae bacterium]
MKRSFVILGGGVTGLSTAYHLARMGAGEVTVLDKGPVGDGSSSRAAGIITGLLWSETGVLARRLSLRRFRELSEELDGYKFQAVGALNLFDGDSWGEREKLLPLYDRCGAPYEIMSASEMRARWPELRPREGAIGLFDPLGGYSEPDDYVPALARKCRELGVTIREGEAAEELALDGAGAVVGVRTLRGLIPADAVVCTLYSWTNLLLAKTGIRLPVKTVVHQRYLTRPLEVPASIPAVNADPYGGYVRPAADGRLLLGIETGAREEYRVTRADFHLRELTAPSSLKQELRMSFEPLVPVLAQTDWDDAADRIGLLTFSLDGEPIVGPIAGIPGLFVGVAFHSGGFAYNPATGLLLAELAAGEPTSVDIAAFSPARFGAAETDAYLALTVRQQDVVRRRH